MDASNPNIAELERLLWRMRDGAIGGDGLARIETLVTGDAEVRRHYIRYGMLCGGLRWLNAGNQGPGVGGRGPGIGDLEKVDLPLVSLSPLASPLSTPFVGGPAFSYMVATVVLCLMLLGGWAYKVSHVRNQHYVDNSRRSTTSDPLEQPELVFVGRVTGMKDCRWSDPDTGTYLGASAPLGREYALASGLMEITYKSGARVILEGPCAYQVDSSAGGFLARGKLTARIGERGEGRGEKIQQIPKSPNPQSPTPYPFVVRTPTAIVTDLGTEFGVEVDENGDTTSYVFEGKVVVKAAIRGFGDSGIRDVQLAAGESVMVGRVRAGTHHNSTAAGGTGSASGTLRFTQPTTPPKFVRRLQEPLKTLDLLDIVAGGNGTGRRRERGIDPSSGIYDPRFVWAIRDADRLYHAVRWHSFIDGVFVPDGRDGAVAIDSSEHLFDGFPTTSGQGYGSIWARGAEVDDNWSEKTSGPWVYVMGRAERFQPANRGLLCLSPNAGITFNLEAMRRAYRDVAPNKFRAVAGLVDNRNLVPTADGLADLWVFIDGTLKLKRTQLRPEHGIVLVDIEIAPDAQFLTLVSTDGGNGYANDYVVFGDPVLEMAPTDQRENMPMSN